MVNDWLSEARLRDILGARRFQFKMQMTSTNDVARNWALQNAPHGSVVIAEEQTAGRGRMGRSWSAPSGTGLLFSTVLRPRISNPQKVTMVGAVAVAEVVAEIVPDMVSLKWPNDVLLDGRKVAGILPEAIWQGDTLAAVILGIGVNVRVDFKNTPLMDRATSIESVTDTAINRLPLLVDLLNHIDYWAMRIDDPALFEAWRDKLSTLGERVTATGEGQQIVGIAEDVDEDGTLLLRDDNGTLHRIVAGEVTLSDS
jgi:BirA family transcriptional regulator, biotin operon repressor / biotin---[acetyl-CoA-carboxylase] ligase